MSGKRTLRAGLCGIGLDAYWSQFAGLETRLTEYVAQVAQRLARPDVDVVNLGLIDSVWPMVDARRHASGAPTTQRFRIAPYGVLITEPK